MAGIDHVSGEMGERIRAFDWSTTPLGPIQRWPQSLRTAVNILLSSRYSMWMCWGVEMTMLYNDAYRPTLGIKHPSALGKRTREVWAEIWPEIGPRIGTVLTTGKATYDEGLLLFLQRSGFPEETYHTFSYSPLANDEGQICGMLCVVTEETERLISERRVETLRRIAAALGSANTEKDVLNALNNVLSLNRKDLPFTLTYLFDKDGAAVLAGSSGITEKHPLAPARIAADSDSPWPAHDVFTHPGATLIEELASEIAGRQQLAPVPTGDWDAPPQRAAIVPIKQQGQEQAAGFFVAGINPYRHYGKAYSGFIDLLSGQIAAALGNARAYEMERRRAEALAEIDRAKTTFFSNVSHELRTPLTLLLGPVEELLAKSNKSPGDGKDLLELVYRNALRLQKLVNTLLDFSRIEAGRMQAFFEPVNLGEYTAELASNFRSAMERAGLKLVIECEPIAEPVYVDREMWEKIVLNLLSNALKFTFEGTVRVSVRGARGFAEMEVRDTGTGIAASELPHLFERFHRVQGAKGRTIEGTGIGLALVQELVRFHGGTISVSSELGEGTTFVVSIPTGNAHLPKTQIQAIGGGERRISNGSQAIFDESARWVAANRETSTDSAEDKSGGDAGIATRDRILLAEDNADMREYVSRLLGDKFQVEQVANGAEALAAAVANPPDLILSDVMMPMLDGFALLAELRKSPETRTVPVILLSARAGEESRVEGLASGADDYLIKPFTARELLARVGAHLSMSKRRSEAERTVKESQATLQSFYDSSPFLMGIAEVEGDHIELVYGNRAASEFFGADGLGASSRLWIDHCRSAQAEGAPVRFEYEHRALSGKFWLSVVANWLQFGPSGRPRFSFIAEDVTEKRRSDELLRQSNEELRRANVDLEQFAYTASHDLQEPLRQVTIYSQLLTRRFGSKLEPQALEYLNYCVEGANRMEMLIRDVLAYSQAAKTGFESLELVDINEVLEEVKKNLRTTIEESGAVITIPQLPKVYGHPVPLTHLFQNLISNALKYRSEQVPEITISAAAEDGTWRFGVQDNGIGIAPQFQTQIFGIFRRLHDRKAYPGTGIGLAICQKIVERYGGKIWVESQPGEGSTFFFTLPKRVRGQ